MNTEVILKNSGADYWIQNLMQLKARMNQVSEDDRQNVVKYIVVTLKRAYPRFRQEEVDVTCFLNAIAGLSIADIMHTLDLCVKGKTQFAPYPPSNGVDFYTVYLESCQQFHQGSAAVEKSKKFILDNNPPENRTLEEIEKSSHCFDLCRKMLHDGEIRENKQKAERRKGPKKVIIDNNCHL